MGWSVYATPVWYSKIERQKYANFGVVEQSYTPDISGVTYELSSLGQTYNQQSVNARYNKNTSIWQ